MTCNEITLVIDITGEQYKQKEKRLKCKHGGYN